MAQLINSFVHVCVLSTLIFPIFLFFLPGLDTYVQDKKVSLRLERLEKSGLQKSRNYLIENKWD